MGFLYRVRRILQSMMVGRNGADRLSLTMLWGGLALLVLSTILGSMVLNLLALVIYIIAVFRVFSKNIAKRSAENRLYLQKTNQIRTSFVHRRNRFKLRKQYRYFKCPSCKSWPRVPHGAGQVKVTCGHCKHQFSYIAK